MKKLVNEEYKQNEKLRQDKKKENLIQVYKKLQKQNEKLRQEKQLVKSKSKPKPKPKQKIKTFDEYFQERIKNKSIPKDTPDYFKRALERAMKECDNGIKHEKSALKNFAEKYVIDGKPKIMPFKFFAEKATQIKEFLRSHRNIKVRMILVCIMQKDESLDGGKKFINIGSKVYFNTETYINLESTDVKVILSQMIKEILEKISVFKMNGSGWYFEEVSSLEIHIVDYKPIKGSSYIPLPDIIMKKKSIINIQNKDNKCFLWSILRYLHPIQMNEIRLTDIRKYENDLNFKGIDFAVKLKDIPKFENQNPDLPGINVFSVNDNNKIYPLRLNQKDPQKSIDLFRFSKDEKQHYSLIKNFSRLVRSQITSDTTRKILICKKCLTHFIKKDLFEKHITYCSQNETVAVKMPTKKTILNFQNHYKKIPIPFVVYADFECFTKPINSCQPNPNCSFTQEYQKHEPSGYCLYLKGLDGINDNYKPIVYTKKSEDEDISEKFIKHLKIITHSIYRKYYLRPKPLKLTPEEEKILNQRKCVTFVSKSLVFMKKQEKFLK